MVCILLCVVVLFRDRLRVCACGLVRRVRMHVRACVCVCVCLCVCLLRCMHLVACMLLRILSAASSPAGLYAGLACLAILFVALVIIIVVHRQSWDKVKNT